MFEKPILSFKKAESLQEFEIGRYLFKEYAQELGTDLSFQNFKHELENIEKQYGNPTGALLLIYAENQGVIGCFGLRKLDQSTCELKRMYLNAQFRGHGIGKQMIESSIQMGSNLGYQKMRLDTLPNMKSAIELYKKQGFYEIEAYRYNPIKGSLYFEKDLNALKK